MSVQLVLGENSGRSDICVYVYKNIYIFIWIIMKVKIQGGVNSCGASKPVYKHVCDSNLLFLSLALVSFSHWPLCVVSSLLRGQHHHPAHPSPCVYFALSFLLLSTTLMSCCVLQRPPRPPHFQGAYQTVSRVPFHPGCSAAPWDAPHALQDSSKSGGMLPVLKAECHI